MKYLLAILAVSASTGCPGPDSQEVVTNDVVTVTNGYLNIDPVVGTNTYLKVLIEAPVSMKNYWAGPGQRRKRLHECNSPQV